MLTDTGCKKARPKEKMYRIGDERCLYMEILPTGRKYWRLKYRHAGKQKCLALGVYPEVSLKEARGKRDELRKIIKDGNDPALLRKKKKIETREDVANTFENIAREWFKTKGANLAQSYGPRVMSRLEANIFPFLGGVPIKKISSQELLAVIRKMEDRGVTETAHRVLQTVGRIFRYAIATGRAEHDITADLRGALKPHEESNYAHFSEKEFREFLKQFDDFRGNVSTKLALKLLILTFVRSGELRGARWSEFDFEKREWRIPKERMKMKEQHIVPLSEQAIAVIEEIKKITGGVELLFPCRSDITKPISDNTLSKAFRDQGYKGKATPHGMRATASTILNEKGFNADVIERQLAHCERNKVRASYNHAKYLGERKEMMQWWGNYVAEAMKR